MTMHWALHPRDDIDRLCVSRKEGGRGLASIEDCVDAAIQELDNIKKKKEKLINAANKSTGNIRTNRKITKTRKTILEEKKQLHGYFKRQPGEIAY